MGGFQIPGGGLDVRQIVEQLLFVEAQPLRRLENRQAQIDLQAEAFRTLQQRLSSLADAIDGLNSPEKFAARSAQSSDDSILTASADSSASPGTYNVSVQRLASIDNFVGDTTFSTSDESIGTGSFDLTVDGVTSTVTIDSSNNTLEGLRNAINNSGAEVRANIVNDGSGFRLTITSNESGSENAISIGNNSLTLSDSSALTFSRTHNIADVSELDAQLTVNGLTVTSSDNSVSDVIEGVTLNLRGISAGNVSLTVENNTGEVRDAVQGFVDAYNSAVSFINSQFTVVDATGQAGPLAGESALRQVQSELSAIIRGSVPDAGAFSTLGSAGVELENDGTLTIDSAALDEALEDNFEDFSKLFLAVGDSASSSLSVTNVGSAEAGTYQVNVTQAAEAAVVSSTVAAALDADESLTFTLGSQQSVVNLTNGDSLLDIVDKLNAQFEADGIGLTASSNGSDLVVSSQNKGSAQELTVVSDRDGGNSTGIGTAGLADTGLDAQGTFTNLDTGQVFNVSGTGSTLEGTDAEINNLTVRVFGSATGNLGEFTVSIGFAERLERGLTRFTDEFEGPISSALDRLDGEKRRIDDDVRDFEDRLEQRREILTLEFTRADQALRQLSQLQQTLGGAGTLF
ncbi:MAG TPA: flagellar filament capping protein FliD [Acidobacteriota bacterium]|nr:flagellar filament capping protein FliD [Acidobacteriota bacterium]